jgi:hypothetical protein
MGPDKPSSSVTTLSNHTSLLWGGLLEGELGSPRWWPGQMIAGGQAFILGAGAQIRLSRDFTDGCHTWDPRGHVYDVSVRFFPSYCISFRIAATLSDMSGRLSVAVISQYLLLYWWLGLEDTDYGYVYHDDYYITLLMTLTSLLMFCLLMHVILIGANIIPGSIKNAKIMKIRINC